MPDTPRTVEELLEIFEDQQNHGVTAQDMRDFVVSAAHGPDDYYATVSIGSGYDLPSGNGKPLPGDGLIDPQGWVQSGTYSAPDWWSSDTFTQWFELPAGVYWADTRITFNEDPLAAEVWFADIDNRIATPGFDNWFANSTSPMHAKWNAAALVNDLGNSWTLTWSGIVRVLDANAPQVFGWVASHGQGTDVHIQVGFLNVLQLAKLG